MKTYQWTKFFLAVIFLVVLPIQLYAAAHQDIACALEKAQTDLRISMATEERIASELAELKKSGEASPDVIETYEFYLSRVRAIVDENRRVVSEMERLSARQEVHRPPAGSALSDSPTEMMDPGIPEEHMIDEVAELDRQLDGSLAEFDGILLKELDLILAKSSQKMTDLAEEAAAAAQRLRDAGIDIDGDSEEESGESGQGSPGGQEQAGSEQESGESREGSSGGQEQAGSEQESGESGEGSSGGQEQAGSEQESGESGEGSPGGREQAGSERDASDMGEARGAAGSGDDREFTARGKSREGVEGDRGHPSKRYDPRNDDIVARQLREAAQEETDPELRKKLWKEYEQYKENTGR